MEEVGHGQEEAASGAGSSPSPGRAGTAAADMEAVRAASLAAAAQADASIPPVPKTALDLERALLAVGKDAGPDRRVAYILALAEASTKAKRGKGKGKGKGKSKGGVVKQLHARRPIESDSTRGLIQCAAEAASQKGQSVDAVRSVLQVAVEGTTCKGGSMAAMMMGAEAKARAAGLLDAARAAGVDEDSLAQAARSFGL